MKKIRAIQFVWIGFLLTLSKINAQEYQPMAIEGAHWIVGSDLAGTLWLDAKYSFTIRGDTTVNEKKYKKVYQEFFEFNNSTKLFTNRIIISRLYGLIRDDTSQRKVYAITGETFYNNCPKNEEYLLFDFSVKEGDTLNWCSLDGLRFDSDSLSRADSIRFVKPSFSDTSRKTIYTVFGVSLHNDGTVVERIIPIIEGFGYEIIGPFLEGNFLIDYCIGTNIDCGLTTTTKEVSHSQLKLFPNPTKDVLILEGNKKEFILEGSILDIIDLTGKVVRREKIQDDQIIINVQEMVKGVYVLKLSKSNEFFYQTTFVKY